MKQILLKTWLVIACLLTGAGTAWAEDVTSYSFTSKSWAAKCGGESADWTSGKDGNSFSNGVQVTTGVTGANATSPKSFTNVNKIVVTYCTNAKAGKGTVALGVGGEAFGSYSIEAPSKDGTTPRTFELTSETPMSGNVKITVNCTTNSIYIIGVDITEASGGTTPPATTYNVTVAENIENGSVTADKEKAAEKATVTLTAKPDAGYKFKEWDVKDASKIAITVTDNKFTMPASDVTVSATFEKKETLVYASLADLVAAGQPTTDGDMVTVTLSDEEITNFAISGSYRNGIYVMAGEREIELYCKNVPEAWEEFGKVSGTITCTWKLYNQTWELCPENWEGLSYTEAPVHATFNLTKDETSEASTKLLAWSSDFVTMKAEKAKSTTNANNYYPGTAGQNYTSTRFYNGFQLTIAPADGYAITKIVCEAASAAYATTLANSTWSNATAKVQGTKVTITPTDGSSALSATIGGATGLKNVKVFYESVAPSALFTEETPLTLVAEENGYFYATFSSDKVTFFPSSTAVGAVTLDENGKLHILSYEEAFDEATVLLGEEEVTGYYVPANTGVIMLDDVNTVTYYTVEGITPNDDVKKVNMLRPASEEMEDGLKFYKLAYGNYAAKTGLGFYYGAEEGGTFSCKPGTAYLAVPESVEVKAFLLNGDMATGISSATKEAASAQAIYNLAGQRMNKLQRGINLVGGKKVLVF